MLHSYYNINSYKALTDMISTYICLSSGIATLRTGSEPHLNQFVKLKYKLKFFLRTFNWFFRFLYVKLFFVWSLNAWIILFHVFFVKMYHFGQWPSSFSYLIKVSMIKSKVYIQLGALWCEDLSISLSETIYNKSQLITKIEWLIMQTS